tara:strand:+ start:50477 stop:51685 length:1209 start_codon:yes stop_codon:yes gene_type:complete
VSKNLKYTRNIKRILQRVKPSLKIKRLDLLLYDDIYPHPISGFRTEEFTSLLEEFKYSKIILNPVAYKVLGTPEKEHQGHIKNIINDHKSLIGKLITGSHQYKHPKLFYCIFLTNITVNLKWLEKQSIPFVFTLYPGGEFKVGDEKTDAKLRRVFQSPMFRKVIVTQEYTRNYLVENNLCEIGAIKYIFGCVVPQQTIIEKLDRKFTYQINKKTFDICFCAAKYSKLGKDKGYDLFIEFAHSILKKYDFVRFHVIGGFDESAINVAALGGAVQFYGYQNFDKLKQIYLKMDVIVSPNRPFVLSEGSFDGFPLGTVVEAVLNGVVAIVTDSLKQNTLFKDKEELLIIEPDSKSIEQRVIALIENPSLLNTISQKGREKFSEVYSNTIQMKPRIQLLKQELSKT